MMSKRILVVDDSPLVRAVIRAYLESRTQFTVCGEAANGLDAIEKAKTLSPDLILMDFSIPVLNGIEVGSILKSILPKVPIVIYTAHDKATIELHALTVGVQLVIQKNDMSNLAAHLRKLLA
jgi:DNA-binding NarL/FixJ family response regulator